MKFIHPILVSSFLLFVGYANADETSAPWSLEDCINHALEHNLSIKQQSLNAEYAGNQYTQSRYELYPNLNAGSSHRITRGRTTDQVNLRIVDITSNTTNFYVGSSTPLFEGFARRNTIERNQSDWQAALKDVDRARNDLTLNITALYLQILFDKELLEAAKRQYEVIEQQMQRTRRLVDAGSIPEGNFLEMRSLAAREVLNITQLENSVALSLLDLAQALDLEVVEGFDIQEPVLDELSGAELVERADVLEYAINNMPQIAASEHRLSSSELDVEIAKGRMLPTLSFEMGWGTNYVSVKDFENPSFGSQFRDNANSYVGLNLAIPIFNRFQARTGVENAHLGVKNARFELDRQKQQLRKEIQQAYADAEAAFRQYLASQTAVESYQESFRYTEKRFNVGLLNPVDYNVAKTELMKAESDYIQAKYSYILRLKILEFYQGNPIEL
ncbi:TolC family protein [Natronoflexus pectinivorans]|uniref:Outer membrane protein n=1 Tax=Natronoflexus pectinivorans TaxID=682526 RepID=A0A4R2GJE8_9BACT|nr:TolC family protein [Natronoflexus pectinivorans]TCO08443.1 outer membrane protein [Natronoflexus pectinivorans]